MEKKIQREREMENGEFDDKEAFVTSAYKKKLEERAEEEEREKRAAALEGRGGGNACTECCPSRVLCRRARLYCCGCSVCVCMGRGRVKPETQLNP